MEDANRIPIPAEAQEKILSLYDEMTRANAAIQDSEPFQRLQQLRQQFIELLLATKAALGIAANQFWDIEEDCSAFVKIGQLPASAFIDAENGEVVEEQPHQPVERDQVIDATTNSVDPGDCSGA